MRTTTPKWYQVVAENLKNKGLKIGFVDGGQPAKSLKLPHGVDIKEITFQTVGDDVRWKDLYPEWIDEDHPELQKCPKIPMPCFEHYRDLNAVVATVPCPSNATNTGYDDVFRLQVNLIVAHVLVRSKKIDHNDLGDREVYAVFLGSCGPMFELFRCEDLLWNDINTWIYKPDLKRLQQKVQMPVGSCQLAPRNAVESGQKWLVKNAEKPREAYVTVIHSSEDYVCGAIVLGQSIIQTKTKRDMILLADTTISHKSLRGLKAAGWKIKLIERIRSPNAEKDAYNEYNYSKLRIWQLIKYDKVIFIDSDLLVLQNLDEYFSYSQLSAARNGRHIFNSGVMVIEPSRCTFETMMSKRFSIVSYNGGDQGFLNEIFRWWHRLPSKTNFLKEFSNKEFGPDHQYPITVHAMHFLGTKPWMCYRDYDCNWDIFHYQRFASDSAHSKWWQVFDSMPKKLKRHCKLTPEMEEDVIMNRELAKEFNFSNGHWKINVIKDPRRTHHL
ncbi:OLC1v1000472C1 [Oldenlandia corymbosa var. corymbosa]|uniref:Hexosyltransferase n=1 Tax=Oldenlandia corymbosa var. corymbosa TaxID=529605 RepID=A0AAV1D3R1_OLDCO|nr:OLC1v1000472C1 [Oldenlandia corymbosa var. corymbosa]